MKICVSTDDSIKQAKTVQLQCIKNVEGMIDKDPNLNINFMKKEEWRFIPPNLPDNINYTPCEDFINFPKPHFKEKNNLYNLHTKIFNT